MDNPLSALGEIMDTYLDAEEARARWEGYAVFSERHSALPRSLRALLWRRVHREWLAAFMPRWRRYWRREVASLELSATASGFLLCSLAVSSGGYGQGVQGLRTFTPGNMRQLTSLVHKLLDPEDETVTETTRKARIHG